MKATRPWLNSSKKESRSATSTKSRTSRTPISRKLKTTVRRAKATRTGRRAIRTDRSKGLGSLARGSLRNPLRGHRRLDSARSSTTSQATVASRLRPIWTNQTQAATKLPRMRMKDFNRVISSTQTWPSYHAAKPQGSLAAASATPAAKITRLICRRMPGALRPTFRCLE